MLKVNKLLSILLPRRIVLDLKYLYQMAYRFFYGKKKMNCAYCVDERRKKRSHTFFGYYDVSPYNHKTDEVVYLRHIEGTDYCQVILSHLFKESEKVLAKTNSWNWQQGARLRWMPNNSREIIFNDFINGKYISRILNIDSGKERIINAPLYDISSDGRLGLSIDFERLQAKRPGYGYSCNQHIEKKECLNDEGIDIVDIETNTKKRIVTYSQISDLPGCRSNDFDKNYLNHISFSPSGDKFLFFWLQEEKKVHLAKLIVFDINSEKFTVLESTERSSHYVWENDDNIICTAYYGIHDCHYYRYTISTNSKELLCPDLLNEDGHPSFIGKNIIITDTYPDRFGYQHVFKVNLDKRTKKEIGAFYSNCRIEGERRTDLHPRFSVNKQMLSIDINSNKLRKTCFIKIGDILES